ncbi:18761_t:CDS:1, partial [Funneliformis geosporum]
LSSLKLDLEQLEVTYLCNINDDVDLNNSANIESQKSNIINDFVDT